MNLWQQLRTLAFKLRGCEAPNVWVTVNQASFDLRVNSSTIYGWARRGHIIMERRTTKTGKSLYYVNLQQLQSYQAHRNEERYG